MRSLLLMYMIIITSDTGMWTVEVREFEKADKS